MNWYKIIASYDGTDYYGWQVQKDLPTVAQTMQDVFYTVFKSRIILRGASRTDAGVHALGHVAFFSTNLECDAQSIQFAWGNALPGSIVIRELHSIDPIIHPHAHIAAKEYWYHFFVSTPLPFAVRYGWHVLKKVDLDKLRQAFQLFVGTHDFRSFCSSDVTGSTVRTIYAIDLVYVHEYGAWRVVVKGHSFLRYMIRRMVGAAMAVATNPDLSLTCLQDMLARTDSNHTLLCAPAKGLVLHSIEYQDTK